MSNAILIAGNSSRFLDTVRDFRSYLINEQLITPRKIRILPTAYIAEEMFHYHISSAITAKTNKPLLILFCGHGNNLDWGLDDARIFTYFHLAKILLSGRRPVTILNDCCDTMSIKTELETNSVSPKRLSLIAAAESGEGASGGHLVGFALNSWRHRRPIRLGPELCWGEKFDHHYYSRINPSQQI